MVERLIDKIFDKIKEPIAVSLLKKYINNPHPPTNADELIQKVERALTTNLWLRHWAEKMCITFGLINPVTEKDKLKRCMVINAIKVLSKWGEIPSTISKEEIEEITKRVAL